MSKKHTLWGICALMLILVLISGCGPSQEELRSQAEKTAQGLAIAWQREDYASAYDYFTPSVQHYRSKPDFIVFATSAQNESKFLLIYDKVVLQDKNVARLLHI